MKKLIIAGALALAGIAHAEVGTMFTQPNELGGVMNFTDGTSKRCDDKEKTSNFTWQYVESVHKTGEVLHKGCWRYDASLKAMVVQWSGGQEYRYPLSGFTVTEYYDRTYGDDKPTTKKRSTRSDL